MERVALAPPADAERTGQQALLIDRNGVLVTAERVHCAEVQPFYLTPSVSVPVSAMTLQRLV